MEDNTISMFMDVKLDIRERKLEFSHMKSWSRYFVRVEAVKCFPCYMRISFFSSPTDTATDLIVRINIPGLTVQMATSRTKQHSYGLFWKNNRKRCCAYFALETQLLCERHLRWMKKSIRNLELYRQEMMQLRRASRTPLYEIRQEMQPLDPLAAPSPPPPALWDDMGIYQNLDNTQNIVSLQDMLGPLPMVPSFERAERHGLMNSEVNVSRRVSGMSGIYEEIRENSTLSTARQSRVSIASGIYEEMKLVVDSVNNGPPNDDVPDDSPPPPLPPRPRSNTNEDFDLQRSFTTPEAEMLKKKRHWLRLDSMFGRRRTASTECQEIATAGKGGSMKGKVVRTKTLSGRSIADADAHDDDDDDDDATSKKAVVHRDKVARLRLSENKRNSFSSPDLSRLKIDADADADACEARGMCNESFENLSDGNGSCTSEFYPQQHDIDYIEEDCSSASLEFINNMSTASSLVGGGETSAPVDPEANPLRDFRRLNISERIVDGFNRSMNSSTVNLVGAGCGTEAMAQSVVPPTLAAADMVGYLEMGPPGTGFNREKLDEVIYRNVLPRADEGALADGDSPAYLEMGPVGTGFNRQKLEHVTYRNQHPASSLVDTPFVTAVEGEESIYMSMDGAGKLPEPIRSSSTSSSSSSSSSSSGVSSASDQSSLMESASGKHRNSVDDKIPSYYPNEDFMRCSSRKSITDEKRSPKSRDKTTTPVSTPTVVAATLPRIVRSAQRAPTEAAVEIQGRIYDTFRTPKAAAKRTACPRNLLKVPTASPGGTNSEQPGGAETRSRDCTPKLYQKYATLARITSPGRQCTRSKPAEQEGMAGTTVSSPVAGNRRFGSLPRFGKIDLSPLRMKINSVLQRHNSGNL